MHPYAIAHGEGASYAVAHCTVEEAVRVFRLDCVLAADVAEGSFTVPDDFRVEDYLSGGRVYDGSGGDDVRVRYSPRIARWIRERARHEPERMEAADDGAVLVRHTVADPMWAVGHALGYGAEAEVVEPEEVRVDGAGSGGGDRGSTPGPFRWPEPTRRDTLASPHPVDAACATHSLARRVRATDRTRMRHQSHASSAPSEPPREELLDLLWGLSAPRWDEWIDYGDRGITSAHELDLIDIATDLELLDADVDSPEAWAPIHACRCLGQLRSGRAVTPLLKALEAGSAGDDWLMQDLPAMCCAIGSAAVAPLVAFAADRSRAMHARMTAVDGLGHVGRRHETERQACVDGLARILEGFEHEEPELNAMVIDDLVELGAQEAAPLMRAAFEAERVDLMHMGDWEDVQIALGLLTERQTPRPPPLEGWDRSDAPEPESLGGWSDLDAAAAEALEWVLSRPGRSWGPTSPRELEGFLFTVSCAPDIVRPSEWIEVVLGEGEPFEDEDEAQRALGALVTLYGIIQEGVNEPFFEAPEGLFRDDLMANLEEDAEVAQWSRGFLMGHSWLEELWEEEGDLEELVEEELGPLMFGLSFFASSSLAERYQKELAGDKMSLEEMAGMVRMCWTGTLVDYAALGRTLFHARMEDARIGLAPARAEPRPGRNDPCPCNSGRKYKKCCGRGKA